MKYRLFIAINLPEALKDKLAQLILELEKRNKQLPIKWVNPKGLHLTLHFLGYLEKQQIPQVEKTLQKVCSKYKPFVMKINNLDGFPNFKNPRIIFINCKEADGENAKSIQKAIGVELERAGFNVQFRSWHEHITLARVKTKCQPNIPRVEISDNKFEVKSIELMESKLTPTGARYSVVKSFGLG